MPSVFMKRRIVLLPVIIAMVVCLAPIGRTDTTPYNLLDLGQVETTPPQGKGNGARAINNGGMVAAFRSPVPGQWRGFVWTDENGPVDLGDLGSSTTLAFAINNNGWVVGESNNTAFVWDSVDLIQSLGTLSGGKESHAYGISDAGQVVGSARTRGGTLHAMLWDRAHGMVDLGITGEARAVNMFGQVCGTGRFAQSDAYLWVPDVPHGTTGTYIDCGNLGMSSSAAAMTDTGIIVGSSVRSDGTTHAFEWNQITGMQDLGTLPGQTNSWATAINSSGIIVGFSGSDSYHARPVMWGTSGQIVDLTKHVSVGGINDAVTLVQATGINDNGWITGIGFYNGAWHGFVLEPASITQVAGDRITFRSLPGQDVWGSSPTSAMNSGHHTVYFPDPALSLNFNPINIGPISFSAQGQAQVVADFLGTNGGLDIAFPATMKLQFPDAQNIQPNDDIDIFSSYYPWPTGTLNVFSTDFRAVLRDNSSVGVNLGVDLPDELGGDISLINFNYNDTQTFFDSNDYVNKPFEITSYLIGTFHFPNLTATGGVADPTSAPLGQITASAADTFFDLDFDLTSFLTSLVDIPLSIDEEESFFVGDFGIQATFLNTGITGGIGISQQYTFSPKPQITLNFNPPVQVWTNGQLGAPQPSLTFTAGDTVRIRIPNTADPVVTVKPSFALANTFNNSTHLFLTTGTESQALSFYTYADLFGESVFQLDYATPQEDTTLGSIDLGQVYNPQFTVQFPTLTTASFRVTTARHKAPHLTLAAPSQLPIFTLDVTNSQATAAAFHKFVHGSTAITIHGNGFSKNSTAQIEYYGYTAPVATTYGSNTKIQVILPNMLLLFPGVARLSVLDSGNLSNSLDLIFAYPTPTIKAAGPNMWASDPTAADAAVSISGTGFIGVPDYFYAANAANPDTLLQQLWGVEFPSGQTLPSLFPEFPYFDTDSNGIALPYPSPAPLPTVFWNGQSLSLYGASASGTMTPTHLPASFYAQSQIQPVYIQNPIPGGGISNSVTTHIAAPKPQIQTLTPSAALSGSTDFTLIVMGKSSISPTDPHDLTKPANGFVANSTVYWNGQPRATTFVSPTEIHASISAADVAQTGAIQVTVGNPYVEENGSTGNYSSNAVTFNVNYPTPQIRSLTPSGTFPGDPAFNPSANLKVSGIGFAPDAIVNWNGQPRATQFVSPTSVLVTILSADVASAGTFAVTVTNPQSGATSKSFNFVVGVQTPVITAVTPNVAVVGASDTTIDLIGSGFSQQAQVQWNGSPLPTTTFLSPLHLTAVIPAADLTTIQQAALTVLNSDTGSMSAPVTFRVGGAGIQSVTVAPNPVTGGAIAGGVVTLAHPSANKTVVSLKSNNAALKVPPTVTVPKGATTAQFPITTSVVFSDTLCGVTAAVGSKVNSVTVTVQPLTVSLLQLNSTSVKGGTTVTGTVTLNGTSNGSVTVTLTSDNGAAQPEQTFMAVKAGQTSATFTLLTFSVTTATTVNISAAAGDGRQSVPLTVTP